MNRLTRQDLSKWLGDPPKAIQLLIAICRLTLPWTVIFFCLAVPVQSDDCIGPKGWPDLACVCGVNSSSGWSIATPPSCLASTSITFLSSQHGCCGISGCQHAKSCNWKILIQATVAGGQSCSNIRFLNATTEVASCTGCTGTLRHAPDQPEAYSCGDGTTYRIIVENVLVTTRTVQCVMCSG